MPETYHIDFRKDRSS